ncbi:hypothetical protein P8452_64603 [Trifolium repens]|nr:hypothetical protein P8452_64603 [Trifolium repens]
MNDIISLVRRVAPYAFDPIQQEVGYLIFYRGNLTKLTGLVRILQASREDINHRVEAARRNGRKIEVGVQNWLVDVDEVIERANKLLEEDPRRREVGWLGWSFPNLILRHQLGKKAIEIANDVVGVQGRSDFNDVGYRPALYEIGSSSATCGGEKLETRETFKEDILKALRDPKACNIGVYGLGGVGKTSLVKEVAEIAKQQKLFDAVVVALVSNTPDIKKIQGVIADMLGLKFEEESTDGRASRLKERIKAEKSVLVILDDIWQPLELEKVGIPSNKEHIGCKLLMTSRTQDVLLIMDVQKDFTFRLELLSETETWRLFQSKAGDVVNDISLNNLATQIAKECKGLPLLIVTVASGLKSKDISVWKDAVSQLQSVGHAKMEVIAHSALELSYNWLASDEIQALFLLFAVLGDYGEDYLLKVAMGLDIFKNISTVDDARNRLHSIIESLKASCLLLECKTCRRIHMHDLVRDVAITIARRDKHVYMLKTKDELKKFLAKDCQEKCSQIILSQCLLHELPKKLDCPNVKLFVFESADRLLEIPDSIFDGMGSLKVLDLTRLNLSSLPTSFHSVTCLQTLCLDHCVLEKIDVIGDLKNLEILSLWKSSMTKLPIKIREMTQLRMLDLSNSGVEVIPSNIFSSLTKLEELYLGNIPIKWEDENSAKQKENASLVELQRLCNLTALELQIHEARILPRELKSMFEKLQRYKIAIGDVWEWSDIEHTTLNTLMLKLDTSIHSVLGIKALIKGVENLYMDEVDGIQNVLYEMNGEGFPLLRHLHIQNNAKMNHIVDSMERIQANVSFPNLETLSINNLENLEQMCHGPLAINSFRKLSVIKVKNCAKLTYLLSVSMVKRLSNLSEIEVCQCNSMENIVLGDVPDEKVEFRSLRSLTLQHLDKLDNFFCSELMTSSITSTRPFFSAQVAFPNLETLKLSSLNLNKIWDENQHSMYNLSVLMVEKCGELKYLFSSTMVQSFVNLKRLEISKCNLMNEIIATERRNDVTIALKEVPFPKLETIVLKDMGNLKTVWHYQFDTVKTLEVQNCEKIVVVFPSSMEKTYHNVEMLVVKDCALVENIFELSSPENSSIKSATKLKVITLDGLPKLIKIWSRDPQGILSFHNLQNVDLNECDSIEYLFPFSVATGCSHLEELHIKFCGKMKEIVPEKTESTCASPIFEFNQLHTILLWNLHSLKGFYAGNHILACPSLRKLDVYGCAKLNVYKTVSPSASNLQRCEDERLSDLFQPLFIVEEVIPNLEWMRINDRDAMMIMQAQNLDSLFNKLTFLGLADYKKEEATFPYWFLQNARSLEELVVSWSSFKKIFEDETLVEDCDSLQEIIMGKDDVDIAFVSLEILILKGLPSLNNFCSSKCCLKFPLLEKVVVSNCPVMDIFSEGNTSTPSLRKVRIEENSEEWTWNGNLNDTIKKMFEDKVALRGLKTLKLSPINLHKIWNDSQQSMYNMTVLIVENCGELKYLFSSTMVQSFVNLKRLEISNCNLMNEIIATERKNDVAIALKEVPFPKLETIVLKDMENLKTVWHYQFDTVKTLEVQNCEKIVVVFPSSMEKTYHNLEMLVVKDCALVGNIFELRSNENSSIESAAQLKAITLHQLPELIKIWSRDPQGILSFPNLQNVDLNKCGSMEYLFPFSVATGCSHLEELHIKFCGKMKEIVPEKTESTCASPTFEFNQLHTILLWNLHSLKGFYAGNHILACPSLRKLDVYGCAKLNVYKTVAPSASSLQRCEDENLSDLFQPLFIVEEVIPNLEWMRINDRDAMMIMQAQNLDSLFNKLTFLGLADYKKEEATFPYWFLQNARSLEELVVSWSSFKKIFEDETLVGMKIQTRLKKLKLYQLPKLQHICEEGSLIHPYLEVLEHLTIQYCPSLTNLLPSSIAFSHLTYLRITNCNKLVNLISSSTAQSLVKLTTLKVEDCDSLQEIIMGKDDVDIAFVSLEILILKGLPSLNNFCSSKCCLKFPLLEKVVVSNCPLMDIFSEGNTSTPSLRKVRIEENSEEWTWNGNLNDTIKKMFEDKVALRGLKTLKLSPINLHKIWNDSQQSMYNMTVLIVENCGELKYLFSSTMVQSFVNLKRLEISNCNLMNEIIATKRKNDVAIALKEVPFPKLETIVLKDMENLKTVWHYQFDTVKTLEVQNCEKIVVVFPSSMEKTYHNLEMLVVKDCALVGNIFELRSNENSSIESAAQLKAITLHQLPELIKIWSRDPQGILSFPNLQNVDLNKCGSLEYLFPFSVATGCSHLEELHIKHCRKIKDIVSEKTKSTCASPTFEFNQLHTILFWNLNSLKGFYAGNHILTCPSLRKLDVANCAKLILYKTVAPYASRLQGCEDENLSDLFQPLFIVEEVIPHLEWMRINDRNAMMILQSQNLDSLFNKLTFLGLSNYKNEEATFPCWFLQNARSLEELIVERCSFKKIFEDERLVSMKIHTRLKKLTLYQLPKLQHICEEGSQIHPVLEVLECLNICHCPSLTNLLLPSSVTFSHLTYLEITKCNKLVNLITSSTAQSLVKLTELKVEDCDSLQEIIMGKENVDIAFVSLEILILKDLPSLNNFCSSKCCLKFPLLELVVVSKCNSMEMFSKGNTSTPSLQKVSIEENSEEWYWKANLNDTIKEMFEDKALASLVIGLD